MHRADLLSAIVNALPKERLHAGYRCTNFVDKEDSVEINFENGKSTKVDILIGADGIHSTVRKILFGPENPRFTGCTAYRGLVASDSVRSLVDSYGSSLYQLWLGPGRHAVYYSVRSGTLISFVGIVEQDVWTKESWRDESDVSELLSKFEGWNPLLLDIFQNSEKLFKQALLDRPPLPRWSVGRVTLLGDACHPMLPFMGQGASQAIEDGATLTALLVDTDKRNVVEALKRYEELRLPRTSRIQSISRNNKNRFHMMDGPEQEERDREMAAQTTDWSFSNIEWIYKHDPRVITEP